MFRPLRDRRYGASRRASALLFLIALCFLAVVFLIAILQTMVGVILGLGLIVVAVIYGYKAVQNQRVAAKRSIDVTFLMQLAPPEFEKHVAETYAKMGYRVELTRGSGDQGIDVIASRDDRRLGIQCKRYSASVGNDAVQQALAGRVYYSCSHAVVVATSSFTPSARDLAARAGVQLLDGYAYSDLVNQINVDEPRRSLVSVIPRGRPLVIQTALVVCALVVFVVHGSGIVPLHLNRLLESRTYQSSGLAAGDSAVGETSFANRVRTFYADLDAHNFVAAYQLLSPNFRSGSTFEKWKSGYATTIRSNATLSAINESSVRVLLQAEDQASGGVLTRHYEGTWTGVRGSDGQWYLDDGQFQLVANP